MTYEQYWYGDPWMVRAFYKAHKLRQKQMNESAWVNGLYVAQAIASTVGNAFLGEGAEPIEYPEEPFPLYGEEKVEREKSPEQEEAEAVWAKAWMMSFVQAGKNWGKRGEDDAGRN